MLSIPPGAYPLRGFAYLCSHPNLNARVGGFLAGSSALCIAGVVTLALLTFRTQLRFVGHSFIGVGTLGKLVTCFLILAEASLVVFLVFKQTMQVLQRRLFMDVLHGQGVFAVRPLSETERSGLHEYMQTPAAKHASEQEQGSSLSGITKRAAQTVAMTAMTSAPASIVPMLPVLVSLWSGDKATVPFMSHYLHMRGVKSYAEQQAVADTHKLAYTQFGVMAAFLTSVPIASWAFVFSNTVGAALWAADLEKGDVQLFTDQTQP